MTANWESVRKWLNQVLTPYPARDQAFSQIQTTLEVYPTLLPKTESFTFDDGRTVLLVSLSGTIPVDYRGARYNIPIAVWLPFEYPSEPPLVYVTPTHDMVIRKGAHVEPGGKCIGGYFDSWLSKPEACSLKYLLEFLQDIFSREPPLYSKPKPSSIPVYSSQPPPPAPSSRLPPNSSLLPTRPPLPPQLTRSASTTSSLNHEFHNRPKPPTRPPLPPPLYSQISSSASTPTTLHSLHAITIRSNSTPIDPAGLPRRDPTNAMATPSSQKIGPSKPAERRVNGANTAPNLLDDPLEEAEGTGGRASASVAGPARPPNPELLALRQTVGAKLRQERERLGASLEAEAVQLEILETDLLKGEPAIQDELARLEAVRDVCTVVGSRYRGLVHELSARLADLHQRKIVDPDELVCSTTVLYTQLWELVIDDKVIDDLLYTLSRALNNHLHGPSIELEKFLKRLRILAHEQFLIRLTINQICHQLGLSLSSSSLSTLS